MQGVYRRVRATALAVMLHRRMPVWPAAPVVIVATGDLHATLGIAPVLTARLHTQRLMTARLDVNYDGV